MSKSKIISSFLLISSLWGVLMTQNCEAVHAKDYNYKAVTTTTGPYTNLYDSQGQLIKQRFVPVNTDWRVGKIKLMSNLFYYQIAGNEWVKSSDVWANFEPTSGRLKQRLVGTIKNPISATYYADGQQGINDGVDLAYQSTWKIGKVLQNAQGHLFYQVAPNLYVRDDDLAVNGTPDHIVQQPNFGLNGHPAQNRELIGTIKNSTTKIYNAQGYLYMGDGVDFADQSTWKIGKVIKNNQGQLFYQVAPNMYVRDDDMMLNQPPKKIVQQADFGLQQQPAINVKVNTTNTDA